MSKVKLSVRQALKNAPLGTAVLKSCDLSISKRNAVMAEIDNLDSIRESARNIRQNALDNCESLIAEFTSGFSSAGGTVHRAENDRDACRIVLDLLKRKNARRGIKSKSMVSEEIGLGEVLKHAGIDAVESDLGEFIVQLAGEPPSHITAPALHRSRQSIGKLLSEKLKFPYTDDPKALTREARGHLRKRFLSAEFGISGANFFVAESGHLVLVENEGNGRMGFTTPPLFIAITGIEKAVKSLTDLSPILRILARSATGQRFSTYTSLIRPTRSGEDGPNEMHVVLVDNGRSAALADEDLREALLCIRCGACLNICPVYKSVGGHAYRSVYPGPMGAIWSNIAGGKSTETEELPDLSTLCGACREVCPVKIDIPRMLLELRSRREKGLIESTAAEVWKWTMKTPARFEIGGRIARATGMLLPNGLPGGWLKDGGAAFRDEVPEKKEDTSDE